MTFVSFLEDLPLDLICAILPDQDDHFAFRSTCKTARDQLPFSGTTTKISSVPCSISRVQWAFRTNCPQHQGMCAYAAGLAKVDVLEYLRVNGFHWDHRTCTEAAKHGEINCLEYLREHGCPWDEDTFVQAALHGNSKCLKYLHKHGCPWNANTSTNTAAHGTRILSKQQQKREFGMSQVHPRKRVSMERGHVHRSCNEREFGLYEVSPQARVSVGQGRL